MFAAYGFFRNDDFLKRISPSNKIVISSFNNLYDVINGQCSEIIIDAQALTQKDYELLYKSCLNKNFKKTVFLIGIPETPVPQEIKSKIVVFESYENAEEVKSLLRLKWFKKYNSYPPVRSITYEIYDKITKHVGISLDELSYRMNLPPETIKQYIDCMNLNGRVVEYSPEFGGWVCTDDDDLKNGSYPTF